MKRFSCLSYDWCPFPYLLLVPVLHFLPRTRCHIGVLVLKAFNDLVHVQRACPVILEDHCLILDLRFQFLDLLEVTQRPIFSMYLYETERFGEGYLIKADSTEIQFCHQVLQLQNQFHGPQVTVIDILMCAHTCTQVEGFILSIFHLEMFVLAGG